MDLHSFIQLREAYSQVHAPQVSEEVESVEEETLDEVWGDAFAGAREDNEKDRARKAKIKPAPPSYGGAGALGTTGDALGARMTDGNKDPKKKQSRGLPSNYGATEKIAFKKASDYEKAKANAQPKAKEKEPPKAQPPKTQPPKTQPPKTQPPKTQPASSSSSSSSASSTPAAKAAPPKAKQTGNKKADMDAWAKANPKLAAAKAERDRTRGTSSSTNPLMKAFKGNLPKAAPKAAPKASTPKVDTAKATKAAPPKAAAPKAAAPKSRPVATKAAPSTGDDAMKKLKNFTSGKKLGEEMTEFDIIIGHLVEQGFAVDEALKLMVNMTEEKREQILETTRRQQDNASGARGPEFVRPAKAQLRTAQNAAGARGPEFVNPAKAKMKKQGVNDSAMSPTKTNSPGTPMKEETVEEGMHREADTGKVVDKAEPGKTYYPNMPKKKSSVALRKEKEAAKKKKQPTNKESMDALFSAYQSMFTEEDTDKLRDMRQERGGVDGNTRYDKAPKSSEGGKKKSKGSGMSAFDSVVAELKGKYGDKAVMARKSEKKKD